MNDYVHAHLGCPVCHEDDVDKLIWDDPDDIDGAVTWWTCGARYYPNHPEIPPLLPS